MAGLQRSEISFRRSGSSGLVWDDKFLSGEIKKVDDEDQENNQIIRPDRIERSRSAGPAGGYRTVKVVAPSVDPPSPKLSGCGICGVFGKAPAVASRKNKPRNKRKP